MGDYVSFACGNGSIRAGDKIPLCQLSSKRLEDNWHSGLLSSAKISFLEGAHPIAAVIHLQEAAGLASQPRCLHHAGLRMR